MKKSSRKAKTYFQKTIKAYSVKLNDETITQMDKLFVSYGECRSSFFNQYCGINSMLLQYRTVRNDIRKQGLNKQYVEQYDFLNKHWSYALFDTFSNINSMWSNLANQIKAVIRNNDNIDKNEQHFLYFILKFKQLWYGVLKYDHSQLKALPKKYQLSFEKIKESLTDKQIKHAYSYLRRVTRRYKPKPRKNGKHNRSMTYDENMYFFPAEDTLSISSNKPRQKFLFKLTGAWHYRKTGNLQIILDRSKKRIEIHKLIGSHIKQITPTNPIGMDKGLATLMSCNTGREYGINFGKIANKIVEGLSDANSKRNRSRARGASVSNFSYLKKKHRYDAYLDSVINHEIYQLIFKEKPSLLVKEDLSFTKEKTIKSKNKYLAKQHRKLNSWVKGRLNDRIEYLCAKYNIPTLDVNPAYTSQYCPNCGHHFEGRYGRHNELTRCKNCGEMNCNIASAKNILMRKVDPEITLYTPYKKVKEILDNRI